MCERAAPTAVNLTGSTAKRRSVPGTTGSEYAIELIPRTGQTQCSESDPVNTMIEQSGSSVGTFRIRSTGYADDSEVALVATFKRASFLDFLYFTQLETSDPVTYPNQQTINGAYQQCTKTNAEGRYDQNIPGSNPPQLCDRIFFIGGDRIDGPLHTNDAFQVCNGHPIFGRTATDAIEVSSPPPGWFATGCSGASPNFLGTFITNAPVLTPPPTNAALKTVAGSDRFTGQTRIVLNGNTYTVNGGVISPVPVQRRHLRFERGLLGRVQPVHGDLSGVVDLWQRAGARQLLRTAHDRRRERHHRRRQPRALGQRDAGADREQLRPRLTPLLHPDLSLELRQRLQRIGIDLEPANRRGDPLDPALVHR